MFALEISFRDGVSQPEMIPIRRPQALIGSSDYAHVVVEDLKELGIQLRLVRDVGRRFRCKPLGSQASSIELSSLLEGVYEGEHDLDVGPVKFHFTALDVDLMLRDAEPPDRAGIRVLRQACATPSPTFPALVVGTGPAAMTFSFVPDQPVYVGRLNPCALRLEATDLSAKHARIGFESGEFWVEDLGSTNGTFVNQQQISGRVGVAPMVPIVLGRETTLMGVTSMEQLQRVSQTPHRSVGALPSDRKYPVLISVSEVARPARLVVQPGATVHIGRDPGSELWLGAPHVSRRHCAITLTPTGGIVIKDSSTNGTAYDRGMLRKGDNLDLGETPAILDFGGGVTVAICFNAEQERLFVSAQGAATAFRSAEENEGAVSVADFHDSRVLPASQTNEIEKALPDRPAPGKRSFTAGSRVRKCLELFRGASRFAKLSLVLGVVLLAIVLTVVVSVGVGILRR